MIRTHMLLFKPDNRNILVEMFEEAFWDIIGPVMLHSFHFLAVRYYLENILKISIC